MELHMDSPILPTQVSFENESVSPMDLSRKINRSFQPDSSDLSWATIQGVSISEFRVVVEGVSNLGPVARR
jgi:hypothetical protein